MYDLKGFYVCFAFRWHAVLFYVSILIVSVGFLGGVCILGRVSMVHRYMVLISCSFLLVSLTLHVGVFFLSIPSTTSVVCNDKFILKKMSP